MNRKRRQQFDLVMNIVLCIVALLSLTACIFLLLKNYQISTDSAQTVAELNEQIEEKQDYIYTQSDLNAYVEEAVTNAQNTEVKNMLQDIKGRMENGDSTSAVLRDLYPESIVVYADSKYNFFPYSDSLKRNNYVLDNFVLDEDSARISYVDDVGEVHSKMGIDVSRHQGKIDWKKVANDGVEYAFIRVGFRGSSEGKMVEDEQFLNNIKGALDNGIDVGVYFYTQATSVEEAKEEAKFLLDLIEPYKITYPVVLDLEEVEGKSRTDGMTQQDFTDAALAFLETVKGAGYTPMIYGNLKTFFIMLDLDQIEEYDKWFAYYQAPVYFPYEFSVWQYTSSGIVDGIKGNVDLNVCMKDYK